MKLLATYCLTLVVASQALSAAPPVKPPPGQTAQSLLVPLGIQNHEGVGGSSLLLDVIRLQEVYGASLFPSGPVVIRELRFRPSATVGGPFTNTLSNLKIRMSTTQKQPEALSSVFAGNIGPDETLVFDGSIDLHSTFTTSANGPKEFDIVIPLTHPFTYNPSAGNLLIDYRNYSGSGACRVDAGALPGDQGSRAFAMSADATVATTVDDGAEVIKIGYTGPQPTVPPVPPIGGGPFDARALSNAMVAWWPGQGNANDIVGGHNGVTSEGLSYVSGRVGQGFGLDGTDATVRVPDDPALRLTNELSFELWFKATAGTFGSVFEKRSLTEANYGLIISPDYGVQLFYDDPQVQGGDHPGNQYEIAAHFPLPTLNDFHHFVGTFHQIDATRLMLEMYLDGQLVETRYFAGNLSRTVGDADVYIGSSRGLSGWFTGVIDEVTLYKRRLTAAEVGALFKAGSGGKQQIFDSIRGPRVAAAHNGRPAQPANHNPGEPAEEQPPVLFMANRRPDGIMEWSLHGESHFEYLIEVSTNLVNWEVATRVTTVDGVASFTSSPGAGSVFFRARRDR